MFIFCYDAKRFLCQIKTLLCIALFHNQDTLKDISFGYNKAQNVHKFQ